jgi:hypothetical protein
MDDSARPHLEPRVKVMQMDEFFPKVFHRTE